MDLCVHPHYPVNVRVCSPVHTLLLIIFLRHEPRTTVREALIFSALLRQPASTPFNEKIAFVDSVIDLLELNELKNAFIGTGLAGLGVEQRKRVTIGVEVR